MPLSEFILSNLEKILQEWEEFAASLLHNGRQMDKVALRDYLKKMLETMAADLALPQTAYEEIEKSKGHDDSPASKKTAAAIHGKERLAFGFT